MHYRTFDAGIFSWTKWSFGSSHWIFPTEGAGGAQRKKMERILREILVALCYTMNKLSSLKHTHTFYFPVSPFPVSLSWFLCVKDKREGVEEVLQHWNPTSLSGQLLLLIMYAIFMHATFPMLAAWFWSLQLQTLGCVLSAYCPVQCVTGRQKDAKNEDSYLPAVCPTHLPPSL